MTKIKFITQGCSANVADSEIMEGLLKKEGNEIVEDENEADLIVFNTCTVKGPTESFFKKKLAQLKAQNKQVILAGCIPQSERNLNAYADHSMIGTYQIDKIGDVVLQTTQGNHVRVLDRKHSERLNLPKVRKNPLIEIVPILQGCLGSCTFCKTKHARGQLYSSDPEVIVRHISGAVREGVREIWLTSQDNSAYGFDLNTNLAQLLTKIVAIPRDFKVRVGMANPEHFLKFLDEIIEVYKNEKIFKFLHIPMQAGSNDVLKAMRREYTTEEFLLIVKRFKKEIPNITLMTDIICGFPTETYADFQKTLDMVKEVRFDAINISRFWPRPGTPAARLKQLPSDVVKSRTKALMELFHRIGKENNEQYLGWVGKILITEKGKDNASLGKNDAYRQIIVPQDIALGSEVTVRAVSAGTFDLKAEIVQ